MMSSFKLHSDDSEFNNRVDALFSSLQTAAVDLEPQVQKRTYEESSKGDDDGEDSFCRIGGERSQKFKRPEGIPPKWRGGGRGGGRGYLGGVNRNSGPRNSTPDYVKNPQNWTRYNMKDTKVLSDRENKLVGLQLFDELRARRQEEDSGTPEDDSEMSECHKVIFKKPVKPDEKDSEDVNKDKTTTNADEMFGGPKKFRMEEYKVGQAKPKFKNKTKPVTVDDDDDDDDSTEVKKKADSVKLSYLTYEEEEENDD